MISRITIKNFKSIGDPGVDLELKPLTLLLGPNGGGKSSILEAVSLVAKGSLTHPAASAPNALQQVIHRQRKGIEAEIQLWVTNPQGGNVTLTWGHNPSRFFFKTDGTEANESPFSWIREQIYLISSVRGIVLFKEGTTYPDWVGSGGEQLIPLLSRIFGPRGDQDAAGKISAWAERFGIGGLRAGLSGHNELSSDYSEPLLKVALNVALASSGARQILSVITQICWSEPGSVIMIEEPEISLHPQAQVEVISMFAEAIKEGKQIIATTHSYFIPRAIVGAVESEKLRVDDVAIYEIEKEPETGTKATRLELDERGYVKGWIPSFYKVEDKLFKQWLKTLPKEPEQAGDEQAGA